MYWANFIHLYQPPTQTREIVDKVTVECYRPLVQLLARSPSARLTVNITGTLLDQLAEHGHGDVVRSIAELSESGRIELTGSAMYHPILPLLPQREVRRQIRLNEAASRKHLGSSFAPLGFFPPEMCYSHQVAEVVRDLGYQWILVDEMARRGRAPAGASREEGPVLDRRCHLVENLDGFFVFFKERPFSARLTYGALPTGRSFQRALGRYEMREGYLLTGTDGEIYGHHRPGQERLLEEIFHRSSPPTCRVSDLLRLYPTRDVQRPLPSSWSTWPRELAAGMPYPQWDDPDNDLHRLQWRLARLVMDCAVAAERAAPEHELTLRMRHHLDRGLHSCQWWWASCRPWWSVDMIETGAAELLRSVEARPEIAGERLEEARALRTQIGALARRWNETGEAQRRKERYRADTPEVTSELTFGTESSTQEPAA